MTCFHWLTSLHFSAPTPHSKAKIYSLVTGREDLYVCFCLADGTLKEKWSRLQAQLCTRETLSAFHLRVCMLWEGRLMSDSSIVCYWKSIRDANGEVHCSRAHGPVWWLIHRSACLTSFKANNILIFPSFSLKGLRIYCDHCIPASICKIYFFIQKLLVHFTKKQQVALS